MENSTVDRPMLTRTALMLFDEAHVDHAEGRGTWFIDNEPKSGMLGMLEGITAAEASRPLTPGDPLTLASHVGHVRFALNLANRASKGENPYQNADWAASWSTRTVDDAAWKELVEGLRTEYTSLRRVIASGRAWDQEMFMTGVFGLITHGAWHLGAMRQGLGLIRTPKR
jgi:hypothetical protein